METVKTLAAYTINLHLKDYVIVPDPFGIGIVIHGSPLGQGRTDCRAVLDAMLTLDMNAIFEHGLTTCTLRAGTNTVGSPRACSTPATNWVCNAMTHPRSFDQTPKLPRSLIAGPEGLASHPVRHTKCLHLYHAEAWPEGRAVCQHPSRMKEGPYRASPSETVCSGMNRPLASMLACCLS